MRSTRCVTVPFLLAMGLGLLLLFGCTGQQGQQNGTTGEQTGEETQTMELGTVNQWLQSRHSIPVTFAAEEAGCRNCHDGQTYALTGGGFQPRNTPTVEGTGTTEETGTAGGEEAEAVQTAPGATGPGGSVEPSAAFGGPRDWVVATDCRVCHTGAGVQIAEEGSVEGVPNVETAEGGLGALCMSCHNGWHPANPEPAANEELGAPHLSVQTDMLYGVNALPVSGGATGTTESTATQSAEETESPHLKVPDTCVGCHVTAGGEDANHTMRIEDYEGCQRQDCHESDMTDGGDAEEDYDGDGQTEKVTMEVQGLMDTLQQEIEQEVGGEFRSQGGELVFPDNKRPEPTVYQAAYNWQYITYDRSGGIHNTAFTVKLLQDSIAALGGQQ